MYCLKSQILVYDGGHKFIFLSYICRIVGGA